MPSATSAKSTRGRYSQFESEDEPQPSGGVWSRVARWMSPILILVAFTVALDFAVAHHCMGLYLAGKPVDNIIVSQAWIFRSSAALAFSVKTALTIGVGTAYVQQQWHRFQRGTFKLNEVDALAGVLGNSSRFFGSAIWFRTPELTLVALVSLTMAIITVISPGFFTVQTLPATNMTQLQVPQPYFHTANFGALQGGVASDLLSGDARIYKLAYHAGASGQPVLLASTFQNETYHLDFEGPAVKCTSTSDSLVNSVTIEYGTAFGIYVNPIDFIFWAAGNELSLVMNREEAATLDMTSSDAARLFVMTNTGNWTKARSSTSYVYRQVNVTKCLLYNATYSVDFTFEYPSQTLKPQITNWLNPVALIPYYKRPTANTEPAVVSYLSIMDAFGKMLVGNSIRNDYGVAVDTSMVYLTSSKILNIDWASGEAVARGLEQLSQNITLSLLSDDGLIRNSTIAEFVPVNVTSWPNTYVYNKSDLFITYGLGLLSALGCSIIGLWAFAMNKSSYQNLFSTFLRSTNNLEVRSRIADGDSGADPLPKRLAKSEVELRHHVELNPMDTR